MGIIKLERPDSRSLRKRLTRTPLKGEPMTKPIRWLFGRLVGWL